MAYLKFAGIFAASILLMGAFAPAASALGYGANVEGLGTAKSAGWTPNYLSFWVGTWTKSYWNSVDSALIKARDSGSTPMIQWYYWGDGISPSCVDHGCGSRSRSDWNAMGATLATKINNNMGGKPVIVVIETEFNKGGISTHEPFDGYMADHIKMMKSKAPNAKFVVGFGSWGQDKYGVYDRSMAAADMAGFQAMRASTRDSDSQYSNVPDLIKSQTTLLKGKFGKPVFMTDLALSTYGGKEWLQERVIQQIAARHSEYKNAGLTAIVYRAMKDDPNFPLDNYYGYGERHFGLLRADGSAKPGWDDWKKVANGGTVTLSSSSTSAPSSTSTASTSTSATGSLSFTGVMAKNWWQQVSVSGSPTKVEVRINDGSPILMKKQSWGGWGVSKALAAGSKVQFQATTSDGKVHTSPAYKANGDGSVTQLSSTTSTTSTSTSSGSVGFSGVLVKNWWQQVNVAGSISKVEVKTSSGYWMPMTKASWGAWTKSSPAPSGSDVQFRATTTTGSVVYSGIYKSA